MGDEGPAVVFSGFDEIQFIAASGTMFCRPNSIRLGIEGESLNVAMSVTPEGGISVWGFDEGIVVGYCTIVVKADNFTQMTATVLRLFTD